MNNGSKHNIPPVMDLVKVRSEILARSPEAALPCNLSNFWIVQVGASLEQALEFDGDESIKYMAGPLALILHILRGKAGSDEFEVSEDKIFEYFVDYRIEVALEEVNRHTDLKSTSATLETIFTNRNVEVAQNIACNKTRH